MNFTLRPNTQIGDTYWTWEVIGFDDVNQSVILHKNGQCGQINYLAWTQWMESSPENKSKVNDLRTSAERRLFSLSLEQADVLGGLSINIVPSGVGTTFSIFDGDDEMFCGNRHEFNKFVQTLKYNMSQEPSADVVLEDLHNAGIAVLNAVIAGVKMDEESPKIQHLQDCLAAADVVLEKQR